MIHFLFLRSEEAGLTPRALILTLKLNYLSDVHLNHPKLSEPCIISSSVNRVWVDGQSIFDWLVVCVCTYLNWFQPSALCNLFFLWLNVQIQVHIDLIPKSFPHLSPEASILKFSRYQSLLINNIIIVPCFYQANHVFFISAINVQPEQFFFKHAMEKKILWFGLSFLKLEPDKK